MGEQAVALQEQENNMATTQSPVLRKKCPKCGESFKPSGLAGHLRFKHGLSSGTVSKLTKNAAPDKASSYERVFELIDKIEKIRERRRTLHEKSDWFSTDALRQEALSALDEQEKRLKEQLAGVKSKKKGSVDDTRDLVILGMHFKR